MTILTKQNVGGTDYIVAGVALSAVCSTAASDYIKQLSNFDGDTVEGGMSLICTFVNGNTAGRSLTIYSSDQEHYYTDTELTTPFVNDAPAGCFIITYTGEGNTYDYVSFPAISINGTLFPICSADGSPVAGSFCTAGDTVMLFRFGNSLYINSGSVRSVNGRAGVVELTASDIPCGQGTVQTALDNKQNTLTFDTTPTAGSTNPVTSDGINTALDGINTALDGKQNTLTFDTTPTAGSTNPVTSGGVKTALDNKQNTLTFDTTPTAGSTNPVTSGGVKTALDAKQNTLTFDTTPTLNSTNPVTSNGVKEAISEARPASFDTGLLSGSYIRKLAYNRTTDTWTVTTQAFDTTPTAGSTNPVTSGGIKTALGGKQDKLTFDTTPTGGSDNPVTSDGIKAALDGKQNTLTFDTTPTAGSSNPVTSGGIKAALDAGLGPIKAHNTSVSFTVHDGAYIDLRGMVYRASQTVPLYLTGWGQFYIKKIPSVGSSHYWGIEGRFVDYRNYQDWYSFGTLAQEHAQFTRNGLTIAVSNGDAASVTVTISIAPETGYTDYVINGYYQDTTA